MASAGSFKPANSQTTQLADLALGWIRPVSKRTSGSIPFTRSKPLPDLISWRFIFPKLISQNTLSAQVSNCLLVFNIVSR